MNVEPVTCPNILGAGHEIDDVLAGLNAFSETHDVTLIIAAEAVRLRAELRRTSPDASLGDATILTTARSIRATPLSADDVAAE